MDVAFTLEVHNMLVKTFGGSLGIRDSNSVEAALNRPYATFSGNELYSEPVDKAAALVESILISHPFVDGNKRTGYVLMRLMLLKYKCDISASVDEKYDFVVNIATGKYRKEEIINWIKTHLILIE